MIEIAEDNLHTAANLAKCIRYWYAYLAQVRKILTSTE